MTNIRVLVVWDSKHWAFGTAVLKAPHTTFIVVPMERCDEGPCLFVLYGSKAKHRQDPSGLRPFGMTNISVSPVQDDKY